MEWYKNSCEFRIARNFWNYIYYRCCNRRRNENSKKNQGNRRKTCNTSSNIWNKKDFSGYLLDPLQIFKSKGKGQQPYISEKSIIRPTFSYLGKFTISDLVFRQILEYLAVQTPAIHKILKARVDNFGEGVKIYMEVSIVYGFNVVEGLNKFKEKSRKEIEKLTAMNVVELDVVAKNIYVPQEEEEK